MEIEDWTLEEFARHAREYWPQACKAHPLPTEGCMPAVEDWLEATGIGIPGFLVKLKTADGYRSMALYRCAHQGWIPRDEAVELIKSAPGNQAMALYYCAARSWVARAEAVELIKTALGNRALALYECAVRGWLPRAEAVELIKSAPGDRAWVLRLCVYQNWLTYEEVETYLEAQC
jgi:hypothetical protein